MAGFDKDQRDVKPGLRILASLGLIWDRCRTVQQRRQLARFLFSRMTVDGNFRLRGWALNNPLLQLFEFALPGSKLVLGGVPNRTSYELRLPAEMSAWYSAVDLQRALASWRSGSLRDELLHGDR